MAFRHPSDRPGKGTSCPFGGGQLHHTGQPSCPGRREVHDEVLVDGRHGVCIWDGRPDHHFGRVRWEDGTESDVIHVERIRPAEDAYIEAGGHKVVLAS